MCEQWDYYRRYNFSGTVLRALASPWGFSTRRRLSMGSYGTHMLIHLPNGHITYEIDSPLICSSLIWTCWVYKCQEKVIKIPHHETIQLRHCCAGQNYMDEKNRQRRNNGWFMNVIHMWDKDDFAAEGNVSFAEEIACFFIQLNKDMKIPCN